ncbi:MAG: mannitol-1-phosphate 5-dehydrogenase, partial [Lentisphaerae bacterium]
IAPAKLAMDAGVVPHALAEAIAAAFHYHDPADPVSCQLQEQIATNGFRPACLNITGLNEDSKLLRMIEEKYRTFTLTMLS